METTPDSPGDTAADGAPDPVMDRVTALVALAQGGARAEAAAGFAALWPELTDPFHRCVLAHYAADVQEDPHAELEWDRRALAAADEVPPGRAESHHPALRLAGFYPSLHLNLAEAYRKVGEPKLARTHLTAARERLGALAGTEESAPGYADTIRGALDRLEERLAAQPRSPESRPFA
ncbi:hypothetical protein [Pseudonocardia pini]|uniref:hypothetical protein n=1 Tax=Pseudonocardia pini TaxID=2758030 RepID=UPI0028A5F3B2|nr:hypothetical protein [Pseudonocardia pini]